VSEKAREEQQLALKAACVEFTNGEHPRLRLKAR
jgi:hypothetical protein